MGCETCSTSYWDQNAAAQITLTHMVSWVFVHKVGHDSTAILGTAVTPEFPQSFWKVALHLVWIFFSFPLLVLFLLLLLPFFLSFSSIVPVLFLRPDLPVEFTLASTFQLTCFHLLSAEI